MPRHSKTQIRTALAVVQAPRLFGSTYRTRATAWKTLMEARGLRVNDSRLGLPSNNDRPAPPARNCGSAA